MIGVENSHVPAYLKVLEELSDVLLLQIVGQISQEGGEGAFAGDLGGIQVGLPG